MHDSESSAGNVALVPPQAKLDGWLADLPDYQKRCVKTEDIGLGSQGLNFPSDQTLVPKEVILLTSYSCQCGQPAMGLSFFFSKFVTIEFGR